MLLILALSFLQPSNLPGCGTFPRPACFMPEVSELYFTAQDRTYVWPLETNDPPISVTYHRDPETYGPLPTSFLRNYCFIDEARNAADCYTEWEYQAIVYCSRDRWNWIGENPANGALLWEHPEYYFQHRSRTQVHLWSFSQRLTPFPRPGNPPADISVQVDRTQVLRYSADSQGVIQAMVFIRSGDDLFSDSFSWTPSGGGEYSGDSFSSPATEFSTASCIGTFIFSTNWCSFAPNRPECR